MPDWSPSQYEKFKGERAQPFLDLLAMVRPKPGLRAADLGCGTGELTRLLHQQLGAAETLGVDSSEAMLARAKEHAAPGLRFEWGDIAAWRAEGLDLVFSNAALHWVDGHRALLARLARALAPGGQLAVQVPANHTEVTHTTADAVAAEEPFCSALAGGPPRSVSVLPPGDYARLLDQLGFAEQSVRLQIYAHRLASRAEAVEWVKGSLMTWYERRLPPGLYVRFEARYREALLAQLPDDRPFFFPYRRILFWARLP